MDLKQQLLAILPEQIKKYGNLLTACADSKMGDYTIPCFALAKEQHCSPVIIAQQLADLMTQNQMIEKAQAVNGYLNIFLNKKFVAQMVCSQFAKNGTDIFKLTTGKGKTVCIDYSSANLAKYLHIGHLSTTILGECIARLYENCGSKVVRINFVGDSGTPFGKIISAYRLWGKKQDVEARGVDALQDLYVEFCKHEGEEKFDEMARQCFKEIEQKEPKTMELYNWFYDICLKYNKKATSELGAHFDDCTGESHYLSDSPKIEKMLEGKGLLQIGEGGAKIVDLGEKLGVAVIVKSNGSSLYITRDIAAAIDRHNKYNFDKSFYVTDVAQKLHFEQVFKILELLGYDFAKDCQHIYYGRIRLPEGKISSRLGKQALIKDILDEAIKKAQDVIKDRNLPNAREVAEVVGKGATFFCVTKNEKIKDAVFDMNEAFKFEGDTSPYMQYTYARCASILRKANANFDDLDFDFLATDDAYEVVKQIGNFASTIDVATQKQEPNIVNRAVMALCTAVNKFYTTQRVITPSKVETNTKAFLIDMASKTIKFGLNLICIDTVESM